MTNDEEIFQLLGKLEYSDPSIEFISMPTKVFLHFQLIPFDLFLMVDSRFVKLINAHEKFDRQKIEAYLCKGVNDLYFEKDHRTTFSSLLLGQLKNRLQKPTKSFTDKTQSSSEVYGTISDIVIQLGIKPKVMEVCLLAVETLEKEVAVANKNELNKYLKLLKTEKKFEYRYKLVQLTALCCFSILDQLNWPSKTEIGKKLIFAAYFCDFTLAPELSHVRTTADFHNLKSEDQSMVGGHAMRAAELLRSVMGVSTDVVRIVLQHHGSTNGIGLRDQFNESIGPLSMILIVSQEFSSRMLQEAISSHVSVLAELKEHFSDSKLLEYAQKLESSFQSRP